MNETLRTELAFELLFRDFMPNEEGQIDFLRALPICVRRELPEDPETACAIYFGLIKPE